MTASVAERIPCLVVPLTRLVERDAHHVTTMNACLAAIDPVSALSLLPLMTPPQFLSHRWRMDEMALMMGLTAPGQGTSLLVIVHRISCWDEDVYCFWQSSNRAQV